MDRRSPVSHSIARHESNGIEQLPDSGQSIPLFRKPAGRSIEIEPLLTAEDVARLRFRPGMHPTGSPSWDRSQAVSASNRPGIAVKWGKDRNGSSARDEALIRSHPVRNGLLGPQFEHIRTNATSSPPNSAGIFAFL